MAYSDPACYGGDLQETRNIDRLAREGVRFTDGYVTAAVCGPSRSGIITGTYQQRFGMQANSDANTYQIPAQHKLMPEAMAANGYKTGLVGKWNMPYDRGRQAKDVFTEVHGLMNWVGDFWPNADGKYNGVDDGPGANHMDWLPHWGPERPGDEYLTDKLTRHAVEFIEKYKGFPFFVYLAYNSPHSPWQAKLSDRNETIAQLYSEPKAIYAAMVTAVDDGVGRILDTLVGAGVDPHTLVAFVSDNGPDSGRPSQPGWQSDWQVLVMGNAGPLGGGKNQLRDGGIRVPFIMRWPERIPAGQEYTQPVMSFDLYSTFLAAAGGIAPNGTELSGANLLPYVDGRADNGSRPHEVLFWKAAQKWAVRRGDWKLTNGNARGWGEALFNLRDDIVERHDVSHSMPDIVADLKARFLEWCSGLPTSASGLSNC